MNTLNRLPDITPADTLRHAATYLTVHGWTTGSDFDRNSGAVFPPASASGAIRMATFGDSSPLADGDYFGYYQAHAALAMFLVQTDNPDLPIRQWNDRESQTAEAVIAVLRSAADAWESTHGGAA